MLELIDGNWVDLSSIGIALVYASAKCIKTKGQKLVSKTTALHFANSTSIFPLAMLATSVASSKILTALLSANKLILSVAGFCALLALLEDDF